MRYPVCSILMAALAALCAAPVVADPLQGGLRPDRLQGRLSLSTSTSQLLRTDPTLPSADMLRGLSVMGDYYLTGSLLGERQSGGLRATSAVLIGPRWHALGAGALGLPGGGGRGLAISRNLPALAPDGEGSAALPYLGIGYSGASVRGGWGYSADLGVVALTPGSAVRLGRTLSAPSSLDSTLRELRLAPMLQLGVSYSF